MCRRGSAVTVFSLLQRVDHRLHLLLSVHVEATLLRHCGHLDVARVQRLLHHLLEDATADCTRFFHRQVLKYQLNGDEINEMLRIREHASCYLVKVLLELGHGSLRTSTNSLGIAAHQRTRRIAVEAVHHVGVSVHY